MKNLILTLTIILGTFNAYSQDNPCLPLLKDGLYKHVIKTKSTSFSGDLKTYFESETFREDFKSGKWDFGVSGIIPVGETGLMQEIGLDAGASENEINSFQQKIKEAKSLKITDRFYQSSVSAVPDVELAKAYVKCIQNIGYGFTIKDIITTPDNVLFNIAYSKRISADPMPTVKDFKIIGSSKILQGLDIGQKILDEFTISCERYPENELILSITTDRENLVEVVEPDDSGFEKEFPIGSIITSLLDWDSFSEITEEKSSSVWDAKKSKWAPADGRSVSFSKYQRKTGKTNLPDMRGKFIRGLNIFDPFESTVVPRNEKDPEENGKRSVGSYQTDQIRSHNHANGESKYLLKVNGSGTTKGADGSPNEPNLEGASPGAIKASGGEETRPKNIAVYFYIRIN